MVKLPLLHPVSFFGQSVTVFDTLAVRGDDYRQETLVEPDRVIFGVIQPNNDKKVALGPNGALSDGEFILHTFDDVSAYDNTLTTENSRQTYARYVGEVWKLFAVQDWSDHVTGNTKRYLLTKYTNIDGVSNQ